MSLLKVSGLVKYFGSRQVVKGVSFEVNPGEVVGLLGPNGAGKTTSFRMATGQITPNDGTVIFNDEDVTGLPMYQRARRGMGYLSQEPSVFRKLSVEKNLLAILEALPRSRSLGRRLSSKERWQRTNEALKRFELEHVRKNPASRCSGGEKRRLEIARCLVCEPLLILLDEPFAAVDPMTTEGIRKNIRDLADHGIGILITDHAVREVFRTADRVYLIADGQVVTHGTPHELVNDEKAIKAYLGRSFEEDGFTRQFASRKDVSSTALNSAPPPAPVLPQSPPVLVLPAAKPSIPAMLAVTPMPVELPPPSRSPEPPPRREIPKAPVQTLTPPPATFPAAPPSPFPTVTPPPGSAFTGAVGGMLGLELLRRDVESLADDARMRDALSGIIKAGRAAIPLLLEALDRREVALRFRAFEALKTVAKDYLPFEYQADAPDEVRRRQLSLLRAKLERPK